MWLRPKVLWLAEGWLSWRPWLWLMLNLSRVRWRPWLLLVLYSSRVHVRRYVIKGSSRRQSRNGILAVRQSGHR
jgi:hypothetical protein